MSELREGTMKCDICGLDKPHAHAASEIERERYCRPEFEAYFKRWLVRRHPGLADGNFIHWNEPSATMIGEYRLPQAEVCWKVWQESWRKRGEIFPEMKLACASAAGAEARKDEPGTVPHSAEAWLRAHGYRCLGQPLHYEHDGHVGYKYPHEVLEMYADSRLRNLTPVAPQASPEAPAKEDEAFEKWASTLTADKPYDLTRCDNPSCGPKFIHYKSDHTNSAWSAWEARARLGLSGRAE